MRLNLKIFQSLSLLLITFLIAVPSSKADDESLLNSNSYVIGALYWSMNIEGQVAMRKGLEAEVKKINELANEQEQPDIVLLPYVAGDGAEGIERQIEQMMTLVEKKVDLIIVQPTDIAALSSALNAANDANIPVVAYDQHILDGELESFITSDNYQAGFLNGEYVAANFDNEQLLQVILIEYPHVSSAVSRVDGFIDALDFYQQSYQVLNTYSAVEPISGAQAAKDILLHYPDKYSIDVIFSINDGGGLTIASALEQANRNEIFFATNDGDPESVKKIKQGSIIKIDSAQFCGELGAEALRTAYKILQGIPVDKEILIPTFPITRETIGLYNGWTEPMPASFKKPWPSIEPLWNNQILGKDSR